MYAVIKTGGKQYRVQVGDKLKVEKLNVPVGQTVELETLMVRDDNGNVILDKGKVIAEVKGHGLGRKLIVFKYRPKKNYRRWKGHRQPYTELEIKEIQI
ncbi:MAG: 50S ribosomal protein L21 [Aquificae bacterium]|jgi:large subunit ribosomal protein L21|nr:50S ribosomal protein L21 [Aquificota bacterium]